MSRKRTRGPAAAAEGGPGDEPEDGLRLDAPPLRRVKRPRAEGNGFLQQAVSYLSSPVRWISRTFSPAIEIITTPFKWGATHPGGGVGAEQPGEGSPRLPARARRSGTAASPLIIAPDTPSSSGRASPDVTFLGTFVAGDGDGALALTGRRIISLGSPARSLLLSRASLPKRSRSDILKEVKRQQSTLSIRALLSPVGTTAATATAGGQLDTSLHLQAYAQHLAANAEGPRVDPTRLPFVRSSAAAAAAAPSVQAERVSNAFAILARSAGSGRLPRSRTMAQPVVDKELFLQAATATKTKKPQVQARSLDGPPMLQPEPATPLQSAGSLPFGGQDAQRLQQPTTLKKNVVGLAGSVGKVEELGEVEELEEELELVEVDEVEEVEEVEGEEVEEEEEKEEEEEVGSNGGAIFTISDSEEEAKEAPTFASEEEAKEEPTFANVRHSMFSCIESARYFSQSCACIRCYVLTS